MMKNFILNWRASVKKDVLNENKILHEASDEEIEVIQDVLSDLNPASLPMNKAFDGKLRKVIPISAVGGIVGEMVNTLEGAGYEVDLKSGTVSYDTEKEHGGKVYKKKKVLKINKVLTGLLKHKEKMDVVYKKMGDVRSKKYNRESSEEERTKAGEELKKIQGEMDKLEDVGKKAFKGMDRYVHLNHVKKYAAAWMENAGFFKNDPEAFSGFSIIVSRHPVDVLRMSDFENITSCHTLGSRSGEANSRFVKCAYAEAIDGGAIAYVVPTEEVKDFVEEHGPIEDAEGEILFDDSREVGSIEPVSRIRIRVGEIHDDDGERTGFLGVPDRRVYGANTSSFYSTLKDWLVNSQQDIVKALPKYEESDVGDQISRMASRRVADTDVGRIKLKNITQIGGTHQDNPYGQNLAAMLTSNVGLRGEADPDFLVLGHVKQTSDTEDNLNIPNNAMEEMIEQIAEEVDDWNRRMVHVSVNADVEDYGDGATIDCSATLGVDFEIDENQWANPDAKYSLRAQADDVVKWVLQELSEMGIEWADPDGDRIWRYSGYLLEASENFSMNVSLTGTYEWTGDGIYDVDTFNEWAHTIENEVDDKVDDLIEPTFYRVLRREGFLKTNQVDELYGLFNDDSDFYDSDWTVDYLPDEERIDVDLDDIPLNIDDIKGMEEQYYEHDLIREVLIGRNFRVAFREILFSHIDSFVPGESMYPMISRGYPNYSQSAYGVSFTLNADDPDDVFDQMKSAIWNIDKETASKIINEAYARVVRDDVQHKKQQHFAFGTAEKPPESEKSLNEKLHRNWHTYLNSK